MLTRKIVLSGLAALVTMGIGVTASADGDPAPTYQRERAALRFKGCHWTDEMGKYVYDCIKKNDGMNAHWCYDESLEVFCPAQVEAVKKPENASEPRSKPEN